MPMTEEQAQAYFERKVNEWLEEGPEEVVRVLVLWATRPRNHEPRIEIDASELEEMEDLDFLPEGDIDHDDEDRRAYDEERTRRPVDQVDDTDPNNPVDMSKEAWQDFYAENPDYEDNEP